MKPKFILLRKTNNEYLVKDTESGKEYVFLKKNTGGHSLKFNKKSIPRTNKLFSQIKQFVEDEDNKMMNANKELTTFEKVKMYVKLYILKLYYFLSNIGIR